MQPSSPMRELATLYFNEDWELISTDPDEIVREFARARTAADVQLVIDEIVAALARQPVEECLEQLWDETYQAAFLPEYAGLTYREWFLRMLEILRAPRGT